MGCKHFPYGCGVMRNGDALQPGDCVYNPRYRHPADGGDGPEGGTLVLQKDLTLPLTLSLPLTPNPNPSPG